MNGQRWRDWGALEVSQLEQAFNEIVARHENLRTIFPSQDGTAQQVVLSEQAFRLTQIDLSHEAEEAERHAQA
ncbi:condensation domain-containing protein, partial [Pseudoalteromonas sp. BMB]|uniref:condensation domain-containing protein n=1 Tax=Pseudoalteromonas sp. BMB TaxID=1874619 RepID=UPI00111301D1